jgi:hypothetical protein
MGFFTHSKPTAWTITDSGRETLQTHLDKTDPRTRVLMALEMSDGSMSTKTLSLRTHLSTDKVVKIMKSLGHNVQPIDKSDY